MKAEQETTDSSADRKVTILSSRVLYVVFFSAIAGTLAIWVRPVNLADSFQTGLKAVERGDWPTVRACIRQLEQDENHQAHAALLLGYDQKAWGQSNDAFVTFSRANSHPDTRELSYHEAAAILYSSGQFTQTILMCRQVLQWNASRTDTLRLLAAAYYDIGAMAPAIDSLDSLINLQPDDFRPHYMQASILFDFERFDDAAVAYERAAERLSHVSSVKNELLAGWGKCLVRLRRYQAALDVMKLAEDHPEIQTQRAVALFALGQRAEAEERAASALRDLPSHPPAVQVAAQCYELNGRTAEGIDLLQQALDEHPHELELHVRLAEMLSASGQPDAALRHREMVATISDARREFSQRQQALVHDVDNATLRLEIAQLAERLGKIELARSWLRASAGMTSATDEVRASWEQFQQRHPAQRSSASLSVQEF
jgi:tetratricopeptide (TPR) repeat protein